MHHFFLLDTEEGVGEEGGALPCDSQGFVVIEESSRGSSGGDPWSRVMELPERLGEKLLGLKEAG